MLDKEAGEPVWLTGASSNFNAHHSPMGAFTSFTCGHAGTRARVTLPMGIEFTDAECASGSATSRGPIDIDFTGTHAHFARFNWSTHGVVR